jgi:competence protein ComEA
MVFILLLVTALGGAGLFYLKQPGQQPIEVVPAEAATIAASPTAPLTPTPSPVRVYVTGAVLNADVYFLRPGSIVKDAILAAGGFTPEADRERINQAQELKDQQHLHVPHIGEEDAPPPIQGGPVHDNSSHSGSNPGRINLNSATLEELDSLPGIGPAIAQRIIEYREKVGGFKTVEEITQVSGIGQATFAKIQDMVTVE